MMRPVSTLCACSALIALPLACGGSSSVTDTPPSGEIDASVPINSGHTDGGVKSEPDATTNPPPPPFDAGGGQVGPLVTPIKHVVVIVKENHTFDNYFGSFPGAEGTTKCKTSQGMIACPRAPASTPR